LHLLNQLYELRAHHETDTVYTVRNLAIEGDSPEATRHVGDEHQSRTIAPGHKSQSERDWAYAKRALARGDDFEEVVRKIADFRFDDKSSPKSYARRTVTKAQAELDLEPFKSHGYAMDILPITEKQGGPALKGG
jgi:hypothetical protein